MPVNTFQGHPSTVVHDLYTRDITNALCVLNETANLYRRVARCNSNVSRLLRILSGHDWVASCPCSVVDCCAGFGTHGKHHTLNTHFLDLFLTHSMFRASCSLGCPTLWLRCYWLHLLGWLARRCLTEAGLMLASCSMMVLSSVLLFEVAVVISCVLGVRWGMACSTQDFASSELSISVVSRERC